MSSRNHNVTIRYNSNVTGLKSAETELRRLEQLVDQIEADPVNLAGNSPAQLKALKDQIMELRVANQKFKNGAKDAFDSYNNDVRMANKLQSQLAAQHRQTTEELQKQARAQEALNRSEDRRLSVLNRTRRALGQSFLEAPLYSASFALMAGVGAAIQQYVEFDKVLTRIGIVSERSAESMKTFKDMAIETGRALGTTGKAFAEASLIFIQQGGLAADNASALAEASIKLANITGARAEDTSDYITAIANSFNMLETEGSRAGERIVDMLAELDAATGTSADEIANAFKKSASSFAVSGFSPEESAAMLAVISETTRQAPELIGTGMKTLIGNLAEVRIGSKEFEGLTNKIQDLTKQFGISFSLVDEYTGDVKDVRTLLSEVAEIYNTVNSNAAKNALIEAIAGKEQRDRFIALVENWERVAEVTDIATNSTGAAQRANDRYLDSLGAKIEILKADFEALINEIISSDWFKDLLDTTSALLRNFTSLVSEGNAFLNILQRIAAIVVPIAAMKGIPSLIAAGSSLLPAGMGAAGLFKKGGLSAAITSGLSSFTGAEDEPEDKRETRLAKRNAIIGRGAGVAGAGVLAAINIASTVGNEDLLRSEKTVSIIGSLLPAIGALFGPIGMLVGLLGSMAISFMSVNKEAAQVRSEMEQMTTRINEAFETSGAQIEQLVEVITRPGADKNSYAYIEASNKLAQILPDIALGQDDYGNAILRDTEYITKLVELKKQELELEKEIEALKLPDLMEAAGELQEKALAAGTVQGVDTGRLQVTKQAVAALTASGMQYTKDFRGDITLADEIGKLENTSYGYRISFQQDEITSGIYRTSEAYKLLSEEAKKSMEEQIIAMKQQDLKAEVYGLQMQNYGKKMMDFYATSGSVATQTAKDIEQAQSGMQAFFSGQEEIIRATGQLDAQGNEIMENARDRLNAILALDPEERDAAYLQFYKDFAEQFAQVGKDLAAQKAYLDQLGAGHSDIFKRFINASKEERLKILEANGFKPEDYQQVLETALGNVAGMRKEFEKFNEEQQKLIVSGEITGAANPLQTLFDGIAKLDASAAGNNIKTQIGGIVSSIRNSKKPLAQQYQELFEIQLEYLRLSDWIERTAADGKIDESERNGLAALGLKRLGVSFETISMLSSAAASSGMLDVTEDADTGGYMSRGTKIGISLNETLGIGTEGEVQTGPERDLIAEALAEYDLARAKRQTDIAKQKEAIAKLTEGTKAHTAAVAELGRLESENQTKYLDENRKIISALEVLTVKEEDRVRLQQALGKLYSENAEIQDLPEELDFLKARNELLEEGTIAYQENIKAQLTILELLKAANQTRIDQLETLRQSGTATKKDLEELIQLYGVQAGLVAAIEQGEESVAQSRLKKLIGDLNEKSEDLARIRGTLEEGSLQYALNIEKERLAINEKLYRLTDRIAKLREKQKQGTITEEEKADLELAETEFAGTRDYLEQLSSTEARAAFDFITEDFIEKAATLNRELEMLDESNEKYFENRIDNLNKTRKIYNDELFAVNEKLKAMQATPFELLSDKDKELFISLQSRYGQLLDLIEQTDESIAQSEFEQITGKFTKEAEGLNRELNMLDENSENYFDNLLTNLDKTQGSYTNALSSITAKIDELKAKPILDEKDLILLALLEEQFGKVLDLIKQTDESIARAKFDSYTKKYYDSVEELIRARGVLIAQGKEDSEEYIQTFKDQATLQQQILSNSFAAISRLQALGADLTSAQREELKLAQQAAAQAARAIIEAEKEIAASIKRIYQKRYDEVSRIISRLEAQLTDTIEQSSEFLAIQDQIIDQQKELFKVNQQRLDQIKDILNTTSLSEEVRNDYIKEQNELYTAQYQLAEQINNLIEKRAIDEFNLALYGTSNLEALKNEYEIRQRLIDEIIDSHERLVEQTQLELEIQTEINNSTNETYKTNLKYLQNKLKDVKLTKQVIDATRSQINLLKALSAEQETGPLRLTRAPSGAYRFAPVAQDTEGARQEAMRAAAENEKQSIASFREISDDIFSLQQQIPRMKIAGEDTSRLENLLNQLEEQRNAQAQEMIRSKTVSALVATGKGAIAARLTAGRMGVEEASSFLTAEQREGVLTSAQRELNAVISSERLLIQSNFSLIDSNGRLIDSHGRIFDSQGRLIDSSGRLIDSQGRLLDSDGRLIDSQGRLIDSEGRLIDAQGRLIDSQGRLVDAHGRLIGSNSTLVNAMERLWAKLDERQKIDVNINFTPPAPAALPPPSSGANQNIGEFAPTVGPTYIPDFGKGEAKTVAENVSNIQKLQDQAFLLSEKERAEKVIRDRSAAGMDTTAQVRYLDQVNSRLAGTWTPSEWEKKVTAPGFKFETGGYTGDFNGGKLAMLHEKELVLNKLDTKNILDAVKIMRSIPQIGSKFIPTASRNTDSNMGQNITINAEFPNVSSADEIKKAFASMSSRALQYAYRTKSY